MRKVKYFFIIVLIVLFIPFIEIENEESHGVTVIDYRSLASYGWEYAMEWYVNYKENQNAKGPSESRDESETDQNGKK
jgi:hypothetical protein